MGAMSPFASYWLWLAFAANHSRCARHDRTMDSMTNCTIDGCAMCAGRSCATCNAADLALPCAHDVVARHLERQRGLDVWTPSNEHLEARVPTKPLPEALLADRIEVDPSDPDSVAHFLETWAQIVRTRRRFTIILQ